MPQRLAHLTNEEILVLIKDATERLGRTPTTSQLEQMTDPRVDRETLRRRFGGYEKALAKAGLQRSDNGRKRPMMELFLVWSSVVRELGKLPTMAEYEAHTRKSPMRLAEKFKRWGLVPHAMMRFMLQQRISGEWEDVLRIIEQGQMERRSGKQMLIPPMKSDQGVSFSSPGEPGEEMRPLARGHWPFTAEDADSAEELGRELTRTTENGGKDLSSGNTSGAKAHGVVDGCTPELKLCSTLSDPTHNPCPTHLLAQAGAPAIDALGDVSAQPRAAAIHTNKADEEVVRGRKVVHRWSAVIEELPVYGRWIGHPAMLYAPVNEAGVNILFGAMAAQLGYVILRAQSGFPDVEAMRLTETEIWQRVRIEVEYESANFIKHYHEKFGCDVIVCWKHNWKDCPVEVIELSKFFE